MSDNINEKIDKNLDQELKIIIDDEYSINHSRHLADELVNNLIQEQDLRVVE